MKYLFINPPNYIAETAPLPGIPTLIGILEAKGYESEFMNLNMMFINEILNSDYLIKYFNSLKKIIDNKDSYNYPSFLNEVLEKIDKSWNKHYKKIMAIKRHSKFIRLMLKSHKFFFNPIHMQMAYEMLLNGMEDFGVLVEDPLIRKIIPDIRSSSFFQNDSKVEIDIPKIFDYIKCDFNVFKEYYDNIIDEVLSKKPDLIGISINIANQMLPALTLAYMIKQKTNIHINIGGAFFDNFNNRLENLKDLFSVFFDSISIADNFKTVTELAEYVEHKRDISDVKNIIYLDNGNLIENRDEEKQNITKLPYLSFTGYQLSDYFSPYFVIPITASTGCYWHNCIFCLCGDEQYRVKPPEKFVDELEHLSKKYNTKYFYFWDNSFHPKYLSKMADIIKKKNLNIAYSLYARFEEEFDDKLMKKIKDSGCLEIFWGLDSASPKVLDFVKKGIKLDVVKKVLKSANKVGIESNVYVIFGLPSETKEDMEKTYKFLKENKRLIANVYTARECLFLVGSEMARNKEYYMKQIYTTDEQRAEIDLRIRKNLNFRIFGYSFPSSFHIVYLDKFGLKKFLTRIRIYNFIRNNDKLMRIYSKIYNFIFFKLKIKK